ncbi:1036_t:CDS:10, partial [Acaulospora colombiana]
MQNPPRFNLAVPSSHLVYSEILSVTSAMRKNSRWATPTAYFPTSTSASLASTFGLRVAMNPDVAPSQSRTHSSGTDVDLMMGFEELKRDIRASVETLDPADDELGDSGDESAEKSELRMTVSPVREKPTESIEEALETAVPEKKEEEKSPIDTSPAPPYGLPSAVELLKVLLSLLDPNSQQQLSRSHTDSLLIPSLSTLNVAFSIAGPTIAKFPSLRQLVVDTGCKYLFQLARSDNPTVLSLALRTIATIFETMRPHLKLQQELLLSFLVDKLTPPPGSISAIPGGRLGITQTKKGASSAASTSDLAEREKEDADGDDSHPASRAGRTGITPARGETRELMLEILGHLSRYPEFMVDIWVNYDCDIDCEDLFERLISFLAKSVQHADPQQRASQVLCLDLLLAFVGNMAGRIDQDYPPIPGILETKSKKLMLLTGAARFNKHPKGGIAFLEEHKLIRTDYPPTATDEEKARARAYSIAHFLKSTPRLDKKLLGEFLAKPDNIDILKAFIGQFDFKDAMREMLESFRLPGESQQIERITDTFAAKSTSDNSVLTMHGRSSYFAPGKLVSYPPSPSLVTECGADDDYVVEKVITGFRDCATLASRFDLPEVFDFIVMSLAYLTGLAEEVTFPRQSNFPIVEVEGQTITVNSALQLTEGQVIDMLQTLFLYSLLPSRMLQMEDFLGGVSLIPLAARKPTQPTPRMDGGLLSALSSYLLTPYGGSNDTLIEATPEEIEKTMQLELEPLLAALHTIQDAANKRTVQRLKAKQNEELPQPTGVPPKERIVQPLSYDAASVFLLETMISIASHTAKHLQEVWPIVFDFISAILKDAQWYSILLVERAVVGLLKMCRLAAEELILSLDILGGLPVEISNAVAEQLAAGLFSSPTEWRLTFALMRSTINHPIAGKQTLEIVSSLINDENISVDAIEGIVMILDDVATTAGSIVEKRRAPNQVQLESSVERGCAAVELLFELRKVVPRLSSTPTGQAQ